jgi:hypothetical protein
MDYETHDGGWQMFAADGSRVCKHRGIKGPNDLLGIAQRIVYFLEQFRSSGPWLHLVVAGVQLFGREFFATEIRSQTLNASRDMAELKPDWCQPQRPRPDLGVSQPIRPLRNILASLRVGM